MLLGVDAYGVRALAVELTSEHVKDTVSGSATHERRSNGAGDASSGLARALHEHVKVFHKVGRLNKVKALFISQFMRVVLRHFFTSWHNIRLYCGRRILREELHVRMLVVGAHDQ